MVIARDCFESPPPPHASTHSKHTHTPASRHTWRNIRGDECSVPARLKEFLGLSEKEGGGLLIAVFISATIPDCP